MKLIVHSEFDRFTYKAVGAAAGILVYAILAYKLPQLDLVVICIVAFSTGSLVWYVLSFVIVKRNGLYIEFRYSKNRLGLASVTLSKRFKQLDYMEFELPGCAGIHNQEFDDQVLIRLNNFLTRHLSDTSKFDEIHFVGCTQKDANEISKLLAKWQIEIYTPVVATTTKRLSTNGAKVKVLRIFDTLWCHRAHLVREWQERHKAKLEIDYLLPYSLEINPDEYLNSDLKNSNIAHFC